MVDHTVADQPPVIAAQSAATGNGDNHHWHSARHLALIAAADRLETVIPVFYDGEEMIEGAKGWAEDTQAVLAAVRRYGAALHAIRLLSGDYKSPVMDAWDAARAWLKRNPGSGASMPRDIMEAGLGLIWEAADDALNVRSEATITDAGPASGTTP